MRWKRKAAVPNYDKKSSGEFKIKNKGNRLCVTHFAQDSGGMNGAWPIAHTFCPFADEWIINADGGLEDKTWQYDNGWGPSTTCLSPTPYRKSDWGKLSPCDNRHKGFTAADPAQSVQVSQQITAPKNPPQPPSSAPTKPPTKAPTKSPTKAPTKKPTEAPTTVPDFTVQVVPDETDMYSAKDDFVSNGKKTLTGSSSGDPHFKTFGGKKFDFHGGCDLVLLQNPAFANGLGLSVHIRTKIETWWSYIEAVVVQIGDQLLELMGGSDGEGPHYWVNGVAGEEGVEEDPNLKTLLKALKTHLDGFKFIYKKVSSKQHKFRINLSRAGDAISFQTYKDWISVNVKASKDENFIGAKGLMGAYPSGAMMARNGKEIVDPVAFGKEWQVFDTEPMLFHNAEGPQHPQKCSMPDKTAAKKRRLGETLVTEEDAAIACAHAAEDLYACIFDVLATNDKDMAGSY